MNFLFRVDAGGKIGLGHYYRSLHLAILLKSEGHKVIFCHNPSLFWDKVSFNFPFQEFTLNEYGTTEKSIVVKYKIDVFYVDGIIDFSNEFVLELKKYVKVVFYQNLSLSRWRANLFILPSIHNGSTFTEDKPDNVAFYGGLEYLIFNREITKLSPKTAVSQIVKNIAIVAGGSDPADTLRRVYGKIESSKFSNYNFTFFFGSDYQFREELPSEFPKHVSFKAFSHKEILNYDLIVSAFGMTAYEFMALGMPVLSYGHIHSTAIAADYLDRHENCLLSLGLLDDLSLDKFCDILNNVCNNMTIRKKLVKKAIGLLDFNGQDRVAELLTRKPFQ